MPNNNQGTSNRGFASMDEDKQRDAASRGGQQSGGNFANDPERASEAGRKGGKQSGGNRDQQQRADQSGQNRQQGSTGMEDNESGTGRGGNFADDPERASEAGRKGGRS